MNADLLTQKNVATIKDVESHMTLNPFMTFG